MVKVIQFDGLLLFFKNYVPPSKNLWKNVKNLSSRKWGVQHPFTDQNIQQDSFFSKSMQTTFSRIIQHCPKLFLFNNYFLEKCAVIKKEYVLKINVTCISSIQNQYLLLQNRWDCLLLKITKPDCNPTKRRAKVVRLKVLLNFSKPYLNFPSHTFFYLKSWLLRQFRLNLIFIF